MQGICGVHVWESIHHRQGRIQKKEVKGDLFGGLFQHMYRSKLGEPGVHIVTCTHKSCMLYMYLVSRAIHSLSIMSYYILVEKYQVNWVKERLIQID